MNKELVWLTLPLVGLLSQLGGTYNKLYRRIGVPLVITLASFLLGGWSWWLPVLFLAIFGVSTLPFTLIGDKIRDSWFNWVWIWIAGYLLGLPSMLLDWKLGLIFSLVPCITQGILGTLSNLKATEKYFQWKFCEGAIWFCMAYPYALIMSLK